ncbi:MAG TPA: radical SAM protein [Candidatus Hydrogenedentes bacterium]|nr:radical SAM protein [Candidatus Hydrogenedentota bacterium]HNT89129.1 radical SAM protein [Candidatus Hydrogenedentota bacterium]
MEQDTLPGPPRIQIQTQAGCNGRCVFCPNEAVLESGLDHGRMSLELFHKIIDELAETRPRRILPYLQNEPLNDKRMPDLVHYIAERLPDTTTLITTNGTGLSEEMGDQLIDAGLKRVKVSLQSLDDATNREIMGYDARKVIDNVIAFNRLIRAKRSQLDLRVSMVVTAKNEGEIDEARRFWKRHGVRLVTSVLENRGGFVTDAATLNAGRPMKPMSHCIRPSREMCVLFNGQVVLCCVDWFRTVIAGDLSAESVRAVWNSPVYRRIREGFAEDDVAKLPEICRNCTESATPDAHRRGFTAMLKRMRRAVLARA